MILAACGGRGNGDKDAEGLVRAESREVGSGEVGDGNGEGETGGETGGRRGDVGRGETWQLQRGGGNGDRGQQGGIWGRGQRWEGEMRRGRGT